MLERLFQLSRRGTNIRTEIAGGTTTFMTMAYIIFVQPALLKLAGMDPGAVMFATCVSAAFATLLMGLYANYPIALAPGMGENFYFVFSVVLAAGVAMKWEIALAAVFISGVLFIILTLLRVRRLIIDMIPPSLRNGIAVGIGLFIAFIGLHHAGLVVQNPGGLVQLGPITTRPVLLAVIGLVITSLLLIWRVKGAILLGILATLLIGVLLGVAGVPSSILSAPPSVAPTFMKICSLSWSEALTPTFITVVAVFLFMDLFDTAGTLVGIGQQARFFGPDGKMPRIERCFVSDAAGTMVGAALGTSTVTSYIESAAGVQEGARTGLASVVTGIFFLLALFFYPIVEVVGAGFTVKEGLILYPITAPALILVGSMMVKNVSNIRWDDYTESIPAFLTMLGIPLTFSIADGLAFGFISYPLLKVLSGRRKEVSPVMIVVAVLFALRYALIPKT